MLYTDAYLTRDEIRQISKSPYFNEIRPTLIKLLKESRQNLSSIKLLELQLEISEEIIKVEQQIKFFSKLADRAKHNDEWFSREVHKVHHRILKDIADGIAWRYLRCMRAPLRLIAEHNQTGHISPGFVEEAKEAERIVMQTGAFVLLNDITNVLRYGDLTIIDGNNTSFYEVKSGPKDGRAGKQSKKLDSVLNMLNSNEHSIGDMTAKVLLVASAPTHFLDAVSRIITNSRCNETGISHSKLSPYLWFSSVSRDRMTDYYGKNKSLPRFPISPFKKGIYTIPLTNLVIFDAYSPNFAPYSIYPFDEEVVIDLLIGSLQIKAVLGEEELIKSFSGKGWKLKYPSTEVRKEWLALELPKDRVDATRNPRYQPSLSKGAFTLGLPWNMLYRIAFEFLSVKSIIETAELAMSSLDPSKADFVSTEFLHEQDRWV